MKGRLWSGVVSAMRRAKEVPGKFPGNEEEFLGKEVQVPGGDGQKNLVTSHFGIVLDFASSLMGMKQQER